MRKFIVRLVILLCFLTGLTFVDMRWVEPSWLETNNYSVDLLAGAPESIRVLHLSDLHASRFVSLKFIRQAVELGISKKPDLIVVTGDFLSGRAGEGFQNTEDYEDYQEILRRLSSAAPTYACLGNHDGGAWARFDPAPIKKLLADSAIRLLHNESAKLEIRGIPVTLIGLGDLWADELDPARAFHQVAKDDPSLKIVLVHNPDAKEDLAGYPWALMFSGHTHGGQLKLPFFGTPFAPVRDQRYVAGLKPWEGRWIHVSKGIGNLLGLRLNCRPEISLIEIKPKTGAVP